MRTTILLAAIAMLAAPVAEAAFRCVDEKGVTHIGDTPPAGCAKVPMFEISRSGTVLRRIDPTPTAEEAKAREEAAARKKEEDRAAAEQKRKDLALLSTYSSEKEIDMARDRNVEPVRGRIALAQERTKAVDKRIQELEDEMEFYKSGKSKTAKAKEAPAQLVADLERVKAEKVALAKSIVGYEKEIQEIKAKYETDRKRWVELKTNPTLRASATAPAATTTAVPQNWTRGSAKCGEKTISCRKGESYLCLKSDGTWQSVPCEAPKL